MVRGKLISPGLAAHGFSGALPFDFIVELPNAASMVDLKIGQRWISETEPELGLGVLESVTRHQLRLVFPASNEARIYAAANAPIKRVAFRVGDLVQSQQGASITIEAIDEADGLLTYRAGAIAIAEAELADTISFSKPEDRLINGQVDASATFSLRHEVLQQQRAARQSPVAGFMGGRIDLIPHQLYIAGEVAQRYLPRVLLADEVGLSVNHNLNSCLLYIVRFRKAAKAAFFIGRYFYHCFRSVSNEKCDNIHDDHLGEAKFFYFCRGSTLYK